MGNQVFLDEINTKKHFGNYLKGIRKKLELTQKEFAKLLEMTLPSLTMAESGERFFKPDKLQKLITTLKLSVLDQFVLLQNYAGVPSDLPNQDYSEDNIDLFLLSTMIGAEGKITKDQLEWLLEKQEVFEKILKPETISALLKEY